MELLSSLDHLLFPLLPLLKIYVSYWPYKRLPAPACSLCCELKLAGKWTVHHTFAPGLRVTEILTWISRFRRLLLLDKAHPDLETPFCPVCNQSKRKEMELVKDKEQVIVINRRLNEEL